MASREKLVRRALRELGIPGAGQEPAPEDYEVVDDDVEPVFADLAKRQVWPYGDPDVIADEALVHLAIILANSVAAQFGQPSDDGRRVYAETRLKELKSNVDAGDPIKALYF